MIVLVYLPHLLYTRITGGPLWSYELFNALFKLAFAYNNAVAPWVMLLYYRNIRRLIIGKAIEISPRNVTVSVPTVSARTLH
ncbi:hypothetical protein PRIPAC_89203 [Pristionchus pacificus]|nr:hypothetical protein PRIPAC_89203 [Pristionchus pacificus]